MLKTVRKNSHRLIWLIVTVFILFIVGGSILSTSRSNNYVGEVFGKKISRAEFEETYKIVYFSPRIQNLLQSKQEVTNQLLDDSTFQHIAFQKEAKNRKVSVTDQDVKNEIVRRFTMDGNFNTKVYENWVTQVTGLPLRIYEEGVRKDIYVSKLLSQIRDQISVTDEEIKDFYFRQNRSISVEYMYDTVSNVKNSIEYTEDDLVRYYQDNITFFRTPKKYQIRYTLFDPAKYLETITVSKSELIEYFSKYKEALNADGSSESLEFDDVKEEITSLVKDQKAHFFAQADANDLKKSITNINDFDTQKINGTTITTTDLLEIEQLLNAIGDSNDLIKKIDQIPPKVLSVIETTKGYCVFQLLNVVDAEIIEYKDTYEKIVELYVADASLSFIRNKMTSILTDSTLLDSDLKLLSEKNLLQYAKTDFFKSSDSEIIDQKNTYEIFNILWDKKIGFTTNPITLNEMVGVFKLINTQEPSEEDFTLSKDSIRKQILEFKQYFEVQQNLSEILSMADIRKYNQNKDISDR